jgi:methanogenic corrinoid protein MtbC1
MQNWKQLSDAVLSGDAQCARTLTENALATGAAPLTQQFAQEIGADGFSNSASGAMVAARLVLGLPATRTAGVFLCML